MENFTISEMEHLTGIRAHTLRMWEKRNNAFTPSRASGKNRLYALDDLKKAVYLSLLNRSGFRISHLVTLPVQQLEVLASQLQRTNDRLEKIVFDLVICMYALDTDRFEECLNDALKNWPVPVAMEQIIHPFLIKSGLLWKGNRLTEEHFVVTTLRNKMIAIIEQGLQRNDSGRSVLLFLPAKGQLDLMLLYTHYQAKRCGNKVWYMGNDVSLDNLSVTLRQKKPDLLFTYLNRSSDIDITALSGMMEQHHPAARLLIPAEPGLPSVTGSWNNVLSQPYTELLQNMCA